IDLFNVRVGFDHLADFSSLRKTLMLWVSNTGQWNIFGHNCWRQRPVDAVGHLETGLSEVNFRSVFDGLLGLNGAKGNHLRDFVFAPTLSGILDHLSTTAVVEVDINIRSRWTLRVQKSLEEQVMLNRVDISNGQSISNECTRCRTTAWADPNTDGTSMLNDLCDDQEVRRVALHINDRNFILGTLNVFLGHLFTVEAVFKAFHNFVAQPRGRRIPFGHVGNRHAVVSVFFP